MHELDKTLAPCPFCGGKDLVSEGDDKIVGYRCRTCEATGPNHYDSRFDWNRRASTTSAGVTEEQAPRVTDAMVEAACAATVLGEDEFGKPVHLSPAEARAALEASRVAPASQKEAVPVAHIVEKLNGENRRVLLVEKYDPRRSEFWVNETVREAYKITPLYASPAPAVEPVGIKALQAKLDAANHVIEQLHGPLSIAALTARADTALAALETAVEALKHSKPVMDHYPEARARHDMALADGKAVITELRSPTPVSAPVGVVEELHELVELVADQCLGPSTLDDPDDETVGWDGDGKPLAMTFGHIRRARKAVAALRSPAVEGK